MKRALTLGKPMFLSSESRIQIYLDYAESRKMPNEIERKIIMRVPCDLSIKN